MPPYIVCMFLERVHFVLDCQPLRQATAAHMHEYSVTSTPLPLTILPPAGAAAGGSGAENPAPA